MLVGNSFKGNSFDNPLTEQELYEANKYYDWQCVETSDGVNYYIHANLQIGDGTNPTYFIVQGKNLIFDQGKGIIVMPYAYAQVASVWTLEEKRALIDRIDNLHTKVDTLLDIEQGNWEIDPNTKQMIFYDRNGNELMRFNLYDRFGHPSDINVYRRVKV